ncbi:hypothetical protein F8388_013376 [Cannabis sativa]|uniref:Protein FAR1-RELATED SEQUENCE n=1 Tax=Cannabis sativa TaxID=3483 RepID=A0A7J6FEL1_CANSA|nr:hypothetical protein F8388_013376 [Cannabis sativa]KAF4402409.1 hypothetical protein G4B88_012194 [Cannabis sativa]
MPHGDGDDSQLFTSGRATASEPLLQKNATSRRPPLPSSKLKHKVIGMDNRRDLGTVTAYSSPHPSPPRKEWDNSNRNPSLIQSLASENDRHEISSSENYSEDEIQSDLPENEKIKLPEVGMEFFYEEEAYNFYKKYAEEIGFSVRKGKVVRLTNRAIRKRNFLCSREEFEMHWNSLLEQYNLRENQWLTSLNKLWKRWSHLFCKKTFSAGIELMFDSNVTNMDFFFLNSSSKVVTLPDFVMQYVKDSKRRRLKELHEDLRCHEIVNSRSRKGMEKHAEELYTCTMFEKFQEELLDSLSLAIEESLGSEKSRKVVESHLDLASREVDNILKEKGSIIEHSNIIPNLDDVNYEDCYRIRNDSLGSVYVKSQKIASNSSCINQEQQGSKYISKKSMKSRTSKISA